MQVLINARILTQDANHPRADALAIENGQLVAVGNKDDILSIPCKEKKIVDLHQSVVLPGLCDSHIHLGQYSQGLSKIDCATPTRQACLDRVALAAQSAQPNSWLLGHGWDQNLWEEGFGDAAMLDQITTQHPIYLTIKSLHAAWINSRALKLAGIHAQTPDPAGGTILRHSDGSPTGILLESAVNLVEAVIPNPSPTEMAKLIFEAQSRLWRMGITAVHDFDGALTFQGLQLLKQENALKLRVVKNLRQEQFAGVPALGIHPAFGDDMLRLGVLKCFMDGAIGPHTASVLEPFTNSTSCGELLYSEEELYQVYLHAREQGFAVATHAIGDRANQSVLNVIEKIRTYETDHQLPWVRYRIEHAQILQPEDVERFASLQVIASMQPIHLPMDIHTTDTALAGRGEQSFVFKSLDSRQVKLAFGSDAPVADPNPFLGLHAAVTRMDPATGKSWHANQRLTLQQALDGYTLHPAFAAGMEQIAGKLSPGYLADLIVLESDPTTLSFEELQTCCPLATMVAGDWVFSTLEGTEND
jgi:predicted amidohydrolase YtcJ